MELKIKITLYVRTCKLLRPTLIDLRLIIVLVVNIAGKAKQFNTQGIDKKSFQVMNADGSGGAYPWLQSH